jgi:GTP cyclohydrolase I
MVDILNEIFPKFNWDDGVEETARRFIGYLKEYKPKAPKFADEKPDFNITTFHLDGAGDQMVMCGPIQFSSICKHHLLPFVGHVWAAYTSNDSYYVGLSKLPRIIKWAATRPQTQELLTSDIVRTINKTLKPKGAMVVIKATHTCMSCRGIRETDAQMTTSLPSGIFLSLGAAREEFLALMERG